MFARTALALLISLVLLPACGSETKKELSNNSTSSNSQNSNNPLCGNGVVDDGEACDNGIATGEGACPTVCPSLAGLCGTFALVGDASDCSAACELEPFACADGDGCCPEGCDSTTDAECTNTCGNGMIEGNEMCDGDCPTDCDDQNACTTDTLSGAANTCNVVCENNPVTTCVSDDGCCPTGCTDANDNDCTCVPTTSCADQGFNCGMLDNGCQMESCGQCGNGQTCENNMCVDVPTVGTACTTSQDCPGNFCITQSLNRPRDPQHPVAYDGWPDGYCSNTCRSNADCDAGQDCEYMYPIAPNSSVEGVCVETCNSDADCTRAGYGCGDRDYDGVRTCAPKSTGAGAVGSPCTDASQCSGGTIASCFGYAQNFVNGYCTRICDRNSDCGQGSHCNRYGYCVDTCTSDNTCPADQRCNDSDRDGVNECFIFSDGNGAVGDPCTSISDCAGGDNGRCLYDPTIPNLATGYCTLLCGLGQATCGADATCWDEDFCVDDCVRNNDCRANFQCLNYDNSQFTSDGCWY